LFKKKKKERKSQAPVATQDAEIRRMVVQTQPGEIVHGTLISKKLSQK
jgi:hypothetical protein